MKGVGPRLSQVFQKKDIFTVGDLLLFFPRTYEDRSKLKLANEVKEDEVATLSLRVYQTRTIPIRGGRTIFEVKCFDQENQPVSLKWFHFYKGMEKQFQTGREFLATGKVKFYFNQPQLVHPEISWSQSSVERDTGRVVPIYVEIEGISSRLLRKVLWNALETYSIFLTEDLPEYLVKKYGLPLLRESVREVHFPEKSTIEELVEQKSSAHQRLIFEELFKFEYLVFNQKKIAERHQAPPLPQRTLEKERTSLQTALPFELTGDQQSALDEIFAFLVAESPMNHLVQGDVGSGKTAVSLLAAGAMIQNGYQCVLMAPTEILAEQHFKNAEKFFSKHWKSALLTGRSTKKHRQTLFESLHKGEPLLVIGTHAVLEDDVRFKNLGLVIIDEQHRFGVDQRRVLRDKGRQGNQMPHSLILTATPIPRTLALTAYGDLSVSSIKELPPGRQPITTRVVHDPVRPRVYEQIRREIQSGRQAYFIFPLVQASESEGFDHLKSAEEEAARLQQQIFPEFQVGLLHGKMRGEEKAQVMGAFQTGEIQILVSTTVVEVGVDVPNATIIAIEHSDRFGLSQLHQLRGRVGRGEHQSYCFLFTHRNASETSALRLDALETSNDGFKIAEIDLEIRGPGEFLGTRQSGGLPFKIANIIRDQKWLERARSDAESLLKEDPSLQQEQNLCFKRYYQTEGQIQLKRLLTS